MTDPKPDPAGAYADPLQGNDAGPAANPFVSDSGATDTASAGTESVGAGVDGSPVEADSPDVTASQEASGTIISTDPVSPTSSTPESASSPEVDESASATTSTEPTTEVESSSTVPADAPTTGADASDPASSSTSADEAPVDDSASVTPTTDGSSTADAVDSTESTSPSSETPSGDTEVTSAYQADPTIAPNDGGAVESTAPTPSDGVNGAEPSAPTDTPIYDSIVGDGADPSTSPSEPDSSSSDSSTSPDTGNGPTSQPTTSPADEPGDSLETGPGVGDDVSLSPTAEGGFTSDEEQGEPSTEPHITTPHEQDEEDAHFGTPIRPLIEQSTTGYTPRFRATRRNAVIEVQRADWIGPEVLTVDVDDIDELIGLLEGLRDTDLG